MISFRKFGELGRLGNQLFQYAYLRTQAKRLDTQFYCPPWKGDNVFNLNDASEKCPPFEPDFMYTEGDFNHGYIKAATEIKDGTDIEGYFMSHKFFNQKDVQEWYTFNQEQIANIKQKYKDLDFENSVAVHLRLGDYTNPSLQFYIAKKSYFKKALAFIPHKKNILVFSDSPALAKKYLEGISGEGNMIFIEGNQDFEDLYLMSLCRDMICSASSFSWWAAYLNKHSDKTIVMPSAWFLPGSRTTNNDMQVPGWIAIPAHRFYDHYYIKALPIKIASLYKRFFNFSV